MTRIKRKCFMNPGQAFASQARQQLALMRSSSARLLPKGRKNRCRMHKQGGKGVVSQPFYAQFLNR